MGTRLERLVLLLDTGSSASVRSAAAKQLGEIQRQHPDDLYPLLERVIFHLNSKSWDSRVAAGQAIEAICDNVPRWDPPQGTGTDDIDSLKGLLSFSTLKVDMVLEKGMPLLASAGQEFDAINQELANLPPKERLQAQKKRLIERLGLGTQFMDVDFFDENDVQIATTAASASITKKDAMAVMEATIVVKEEPKGKEDPFAGLSARERNQLKRKMKQASKNQGKDGSSFATDISSSSALKKRKIAEDQAPAGPVDPNTTVVSFKPKADVSSLSVFSSGDEWPFEGLVEKLSFDLFSPRWETRHGAAIGLREVLKVHGKGYGKVVGLKKQENQERNQQMLEDLAVRLLCVLCLDRFADFVGDQAVIPVRETCAQTLAVVLEHCQPNLCMDIIQKGLLFMVYYQSSAKTSHGDEGNIEQKWAVRHAALIGIKYWMAVRQDLLDQILVPDSLAFLAIVEGLKDHNDDVRAVSSSALLPITDLLVKLIPEKKIFESVVICLWDSLQELDDLTAATSSVMDLLSDLLRKPTIAAVLQTEATNFLEKLVPQFFPFFRHAVTSVRLAVLRTLSTLATLAAENTSLPVVGWITIDLLRLLFQNFVLEEKKDVVALSLSVWGQLVDLLDRVDADVIEEILKPHMSIMIALGVSPIGKPLDHRLFISYQKEGSAKRTKGAAGLNIPPQDRAIMNQELTVVSFNTILHGRIAASTAIGRLICNLSIFYSSSPDCILDWIMTYANSGWGVHRLLTGIIIQEWVEYYNMKSSSIGHSSSFLESHGNWKTIWEALMSVLNDVNAGATLYFVELQDHLNTLWNECTYIYNALARLGREPPLLPPIVATAESASLNSPLGAQFTLESADIFLDQFCPSVMNGVSDSLLELYRKSLSTKLTLTSIKQTLDPRVYSSLAAAVVSMGNLPHKLNPIIRNLMNSIQSEENGELQVRSARGIAKMIHINVTLGVRSQVNDKIVKNLCAFLCSDPSTVGIVAEQSSHTGTVTFSKLKAIKNATKKAGGKKKTASSAAANVDLDGAANDAIQDAALSAANEQELIGKKILHAGAESAIEALCGLFGENLFHRVPALLDIATNALLTSSPLLIESNGALTPDNELAQLLVDNLHVLEILAKYIDQMLYPQLLDLMDPIKDCLSCHLSLVRHLASACLASMAKRIGVPAMIKVIDLVLPLANHATVDFDRQGSVETSYFIINCLQEAVMPYLIFLMAPLLSRMSDSDEDVRFLATNGFAQLVKLAPLEAGTPNPPGFPQELVDRKNIERKFIGQLIGTEKIQEFELPVAINAELRSYQKDGVSWLAFLNRYGLHGILCDDMGLGKTLQCICIISADSYNRAQEYEKTKSADFAHCPTLIVCPSPLTGHWYFEIKKYADFMKPIIYTGDKNERAAIRKKMMSHDVIIISYEVLRNDIEYLSKLRFNYCCLDEGHVIKNPSTKLTKSVKMVKAFHRLILSGTPVQNNVMDLWSLFDFLMPGFLGTEAQFQEKFGKPILASREAKASSREQERGALALEALHKQVLPFLMRRMKEDVLEDLPPKIIQDYYCELSDIQKMLYEDFSLASDDANTGEGQEDSHEKKGGQAHVFQALQYLKKLCNHPAFVLKPSHPQYDKVQAKLKAEKRSINDIENAPKLTALQQLLLDCGIGVERNELSGVTAPHRVLIFAQVKEMLDLIQNDLFKKHMPTVSYMRLDGQITDPIKRHELIQTFNQDSSIDVLLLTTHVGGLGLNLTGADTVIFMEHDWNPMKDLQAMDRAHRIGQKRVVNVYRLITKGTVEEKIMGLQKFKINISSAIINSENADISTMGTDQIVDLFSIDSGDGSGRAEDKKDASTGKVGAKDAIANLSQLWDEAEYEDLQVDDFLKNLKSRRK